VSLLCALAVGCGGAGLDGSAEAPELATTSQAVSNWADDEEILRAFQPEWRFASGHRCFPLDVAAGESDGDTCRGGFTPNFTVFAKVNRLAGSPLPNTLRVAYAVAYGFQDDSFLFWGHHNDDVETVVVDIVNGQPIAVRFNVHRGAYVRMLSNLELVDGTHPVVYVGAIGHASYHGISDPTATGCALPSTVCNFGDARGNTYRSRGSIVRLSNRTTDEARGLGWHLIWAGYGWKNAPGNKQEFNNPYSLIGCDSGDTRGGEICTPSDQDDTSLSPSLWLTSFAGYYLSGATAGGPHSAQYNDLINVAGRRLTKVLIRAGERVDAVSATYDNSITYFHGGGGGSPRELTLQAGEYLSRMDACWGSKDGSTRVFYLALHTNLGRVLSGGRTTAQCRTWYASASDVIIGFFGRSGAELDKVGPIFHRVASPAPGRQVCFYKDVDFRGEHRCHGVGDYPTMDGGWNDAISSARVFGGASAEVFKDVNYGPDSRWFNTNIPHFHNNLAFNDHVSSFKVR
jgi:hypothetical protein